MKPRILIDKETGEEFEAIPHYCPVAGELDHSIFYLKPIKKLLDIQVGDIVRKAKYALDEGSWFIITHIDDDLFYYVSPRTGEEQVSDAYCIDMQKRNDKLIWEKGE